MPATVCELVDVVAMPVGVVVAATVGPGVTVGEGVVDSVAMMYAGYCIIFWCSERSDFLCTHSVTLQIFARGRLLTQHLVCMRQLTHAPRPSRLG